MKGWNNLSVQRTPVAIWLVRGKDRDHDLAKHVEKEHVPLQGHGATWLVMLASH